MSDAPDTWFDHINDEPEYVQRMVRWFFEHYEASTENESVPFYAEDVIEDQFCEEYEPEEISRTVDFIGEWGDEWVQVSKERDTEPPDTEDELEDDEIQEEQKEIDDE